MKDSLGNSVHLNDAGSLAALNDFVDGILRCEARAVNVLALAESDESAIAQAYCAALHMFAETRDGPVNARPFIDAAIAAAPRASTRERQFVAAIAAWIDGDLAQAIGLHQQLARTHPRDLVSVKLGQYHLFNQGDAIGMLRLALAALPAASDVAQMHGMAAFGWEQCHLMPQAEAAGRTALAMTPREPWAQHALAHVMLTQGRLQEGQQFMRHCSPTWTGLNSFMETHNWWHLALFEIDLGHADAALALYDRQVWGVVKAYSQDQIGAVSLLARLELAGVDVGDRWQDVADHLQARTADQVLPFLDLQYLYGLARAGRPQAETLLRNIEAHGQTLAGSTGTSVTNAAPVWREVATPAAYGLMAHAQGRHAQAIEALGQALPKLLQIGGSHAQRDLFEQIHLDALLRCGHWAAAQQLVQQRCNHQPQSVRLQRQAARIYSVLGIDTAAA
ncbi:MAG: tetratricopeptide repeat protein [Burkholderiaceae bacterium]